MNYATAMNPKSKLLLVEDDPVLGKGLKINFESEGFDVHWERDLKGASLFLTQAKLDLVILDLGLPDGSGLTLCKSMRDGGNGTPVLILTAKTDEDSVVDGLQAGANDYMKKPFGNKELLARVKNILKQKEKSEKQARFENLVMNLDQRKVHYEDREIVMNRREFDILLHFVKNSGSVVTRESLLAKLDKDGEIFDRTIDSHVSHVRARLRKANVTDLVISSVYGVGYRLEKA